jgi:hypothetical protein
MKTLIKPVLTGVVTGASFLSPVVTGVDVE